jgi:hypothetical protein
MEYLMEYMRTALQHSELRPPYNRNVANIVQLGSTKLEHKIPKVFFNLLIPKLCH